MILTDLSQIAISNIMMTPSIKSNEIDVNLVKHMILTSIKNYRQQFRSEYGEIVICCDGKNNWRRQRFPHYKAGRKKDKNNSFINWDIINEAVNEMKNDLRENFPYKVIEVEGAEADDVIAVLSKYIKEPTVIISSDKDFGQLQKFDHVKQYCPKAKDFIVISNPENHLKELILRGDRSDGIPNFLSDGDTFVNQSKRQKSITAAKLPTWMTQDIEQEFDEQIVENYKRNRELISFEYIPKTIVRDIVKEYLKEPIGGKKKMMDYFVKNKMRILLSSIGQF